MREIVFDTETTGLDNQADRVIEIGAVELENRFPTGRSFHAYINPQGRAIHPDAEAVHGISATFLSDKPTMNEVADQFLEFVGDGTLVAHNANFDMGFMNAEFARIGLAPFPNDRVTDSLAIARRRHPLAGNSLDALCKRYGIDNSHRTKHGALLDAELLAEVYIEMVTGRQASFGLTVEDDATDQKTDRDQENVADAGRLTRPAPLPDRLSDTDREAHRTLVRSLGAEALWAQYDRQGNG